MFDILQVIFWGITYVLIIISLSRKEYSKAIPYSACILNFVWEINALISSNGHWAHILWLTLDIIIYSLNIYHLYKKNKIDLLIYILSTIVLFIIVNILFYYNQMLLSCFIIDIIMALVYLKDIKNMSIHYKKAIAITKFIGDGFAWMAYMNQEASIFWIGLIVFIVNITYIIVTFNDKKRL